MLLCFPNYIYIYILFSKYFLDNSNYILNKKKAENDCYSNLTHKKNGGLTYAKI